MIVQLNARLVAQGSSQVQDVDYFQTFVSTLSSAPVKLLAAAANEHSLTTLYLGILPAFVHAKRDHEIYMELPDGCPERPFALTDRCMVYSRADDSGSDYW